MESRNRMNDEDGKVRITADQEALAAEARAQRGRLANSRAMMGNQNARKTIPTLIGIGGKLGSGKDTAADFLVQEYGFIKLGMSDPLHAALMTQNPWIRVEDVDHLKSPESHEFYALIESGVKLSLGPAKPEDRVHGVLFCRYADITNTLGYTRAKNIKEYREALQLLGTDVARKQWNEDHWVNVAAQRIYKIRGGQNETPPAPVIITGMRFENEAEMIRNMRGVLVYVNRPSALEKLPSLNRLVAQHSGIPADLKIDMHSSEVSLTEEDFDITLDNDSSLDDLRIKTLLMVDTIRAVQP